MVTSPCFLKLAIIPMIITVRIYYKDISTISDPRSSPALIGRHNVTQLPLSLCRSGSVISWTPTAASAMDPEALSHPPSLEPFQLLPLYALR